MKSEQLLTVLNGRYAYAPLMSEQLLTVLKWRHAYAPLISEQLLIVLNDAMPIKSEQLLTV